MVSIDMGTNLIKLLHLLHTYIAIAFFFMNFPKPCDPLWKKPQKIFSPVIQKQAPNCPSVIEG